MPNRTARPRRIVWVVYTWSTQSYAAAEIAGHSPEFIARQTDPVRRALVGRTD